VIDIHLITSNHRDLQEEFTFTVARVESIPLATKRLGDFVRSRQAESERHPVRGGAGVNGLSPALRFEDAPRFVSMLAESFGGG